MGRRMGGWPRSPSSVALAQCLTDCATLPRSRGCAMKRLAFAVALLIGLTVPTWAAKDEPLSVEGASSGTSKLLVAGMAYGIAYFNVTLVLSGRPRLFCPPPKTSVNGRLLWELASQVLEGPHEPGIIAAAALDELQRKFPCSK